MALALLLAALLAQTGPRESFIICPGNPRCPRGAEGRVPVDELDRPPPTFAAPETAAAPADPAAESGRVVYFAGGSFALNHQARAVLERVADWLAANPRLLVNIEGHADVRGSREANLALAARRAEAVREFLVARGIAVGRLATISYGEERPALYDYGESVWMMNRRVEIRVR